MRITLGDVESKLDILRRAIDDLRRNDGRRDQEIDALKHRVDELQTQSIAAADSLNVLRQAQIDARGALTSTDARLLEAQRKISDTSRFVSVLLSDLLVVQSRRLADNTSIASSISSLARARTKELQDAMVAQEAAKRAEAAARAAADGRILDNFIPCELTEEMENKLKPRRRVPKPAAVEPADIDSALTSLTRQGYTIPDTFAADVMARKSAAVPLARTLNQYISEKVDTGEIVGPNNQTKQETKEQVMNAVTTPVAELAAPIDVGCQMTMLPWEVTADSFGRHVADQFIAFHVNVRNLNASQEFVLHNTSIAIDEGRFYASVDRMLVRNTQGHGNAYDRRNFWMRALEVAGDLAAGAAPYANSGMQAGIAIFRAALIPGIGKIFPDRYLSQINALNDLGFSSQTAYKMIVPVKGSAPFVTFLPAAIFSRKKGTPVAGDKNWHYKKWDADQLYNFAESTFVIVAGVHVTEVANVQPSLSAIDCHTDAATKNLACTLTGRNLDKVAKVSLRNAVETSDTVRAEAGLTLSGGQTTSATVVIPAAAMARLKGSEYAVFLLPGDSKPEIPTTLTVSLTVSLDAPSLALRLGDSDCLENGCTLTIAGSGLLQVKQLLLDNSDGKEIASAASDSSSTNASLKVKLDLSQVTASGDYTLKLLNAGTSLGTLTLKITRVPSIETIAPKTWSKAAPGCTDGCDFVLTGQRLDELTKVVLADGDTVKATATAYKAATGTVTFKKTDLDALEGDFKIAGKTKDGQSDAKSKATLTIKAQ